MKSIIPDSLFVRLFLLLFVILSISIFAGREVFIMLGLEHAPSSVHRDPFRLYTILLVRLGAVALTAWVAARWLSYPIKRMAKAAEELGNNLNSPNIEETSGPSEVRQASKVFNQMKARINLQMEERNRFLAAVSHDLRTPLTRLKLKAEKMDQQELQADIQEDINEMASIIDTTLDYLRGDERPETECMLDIGALVHSMVEDAEERGESVTVSGNANPIKLQPLAIRRCLGNLIENALRYGESASIVIGETDSNVVITIRDFGPGIPEDQLESVFAPFYRLDTSRNRNHGGVGLGLSIARDMARKQGGDIALKNAQGGGLVATLLLPKQH
ncbi:osmolarity sensor protein EnvZ [mine drainage metagenome]|uniref:histidine kinase n=1 Tax=mine drainage metagenome TaxID=410659 RepID=A0A1J5RU25_9ZZZZ